MNAKVLKLYTNKLQKDEGSESGLQKYEILIELNKLQDDQTLFLLQFITFKRSTIGICHYFLKTPLHSKSDNESQTQF